MTFCEDTIEVPLYYTGLTDSAKLVFEDKTVDVMQLDRHYTVPIKVGAYCYEDQLSVRPVLPPLIPENFPSAFIRIGLLCILFRVGTSSTYLGCLLGTGVTDPSLLLAVTALIIFIWSWTSLSLFYNITWDAGWEDERNISLYRRENKTTKTSCITSSRRRWLRSSR